MDFLGIARRLLKSCSDFVGLLGMMLESAGTLWFPRADFVARSRPLCPKVPHPGRATVKS
jgi:hypothetical protein